MVRLVVGIGAALVVILSVLGPARARAQEDDTTRARAEFAHGVEFFQGSDYQRALDAFQEAYRLAPHASVRLNIANCYQQLGRPVEALFHFERYLAEADHPAAAQRREVESSIRTLRTQVGTITLHITPDGATITIDSTDQRRSPVSEPVRVTAGRHIVEIRLDGYRTETQTVEVTGGSDARVSLRLARAETVAATTTVVPPTTVESTTTTTAETSPTTGPTVTATAETTSPTTSETTPATPTRTASPEEPIDGEATGDDFRLGIPTIIAGSVTLAALVVALVTGPLALGANSAFERDVVDANDPAVAPMDQAQARIDGQAHAADARAFATVTDVMLVTTIVGAGATTALFILDQTSGDDAERVAIVPVVTPQAVAITASGHF